MPQVFHIAPGVVRSGLLMIPAALIVLVLGLSGFALFKTLSGARSATFELSADGLRIKGDLYGRFIPLKDLVPSEAKRVTITEGPLRPTMRTAGTALPGYRSGWFRLANGTKGLLYATDPTRIVHVPTTAGYSLLLSVAETDAFVERMHALGGRDSASQVRP
ncbi:MAG TPA: PH domain-containing protein [Gemmatimonadaceae bacterium]|nr:PH domain-containing protein [Gemmatimonadaceae bacterium]